VPRARRGPRRGDWLRRAAAGSALPVALGLAAPARAFDAALYARLLAAHTREVADAAGTRVDYAGLRASADWPRLVASLAQSDPERLASRAERLAFWINAYNALAIETVLRAWPVASIRDAGSWLRPVWRREAGRVGGRPRSLDEIEHGILRPLGEPRIHAAIVCASVSCPSLRREPFAPERLEAQLDDALRRFLADPRKGYRSDRARERVAISKIFDWFAEDFGGGERERLAFLLPYLPEPERAWLAPRIDRVEVDHLAYDWSLNGTP
jgi:hypothetical protein